MNKAILILTCLVVVWGGGYFYGTMERIHTIDFEYIGNCAPQMHEVVCDGQVYIIPIPDGDILYQDRYASEYCAYIKTLDND